MNTSSAERKRLSWRGMLPVLLLGGLVGLIGCEYRSGEAARQPLPEEPGDAPDQITTDAQFFIYEEDRPRALVEARRMERYESEDSTYTLLHAPLSSEGSCPGEGRPPPARDSAAGTPGPDSTKAAGPRAGRVATRIFSPADAESEEAARDSVAAVIRADRLIYHDEDGRFEARGRVVVTTPDGKRLEGEHLAWREEERRITTPGFVEITTLTDRIQGYGLRADENLDTYRLERVTGEVTVEDTP